MLTNERTNFWALSPSVLTKCLELVGFREIRQLRLTPLGAEGLVDHMARVMLVARKSERPSFPPYALQVDRVYAAKAREAGSVSVNSTGVPRSTQGLNLVKRA